MDSNTSDNIRRLPNGSMDLAFYANRSRRLRSRAAHRGLRKIGRSMRRLWTEPFRFGRWVVAVPRRRYLITPQSGVGLAACRLG